MDWFQAFHEVGIAFAGPADYCRRRRRHRHRNMPVRQAVDRGARAVPVRVG
jgi:hypothetical protein